jgi:hypothetical protein
MAHFRGTIQGQRGSASRLGSVKSGLTVKANGWDFGVEVFLSNRDGIDTARIYLMGGSNDRGTPRCIGEFTAADIPTPIKKAS